MRTRKRGGSSIRDYLNSTVHRVKERWTKNFERNRLYLTFGRRKRRKPLRIKGPVIHGRVIRVIPPPAILPAVIPKRPVAPAVIPKRPVAPDVIPKRPVTPAVIPKRPVTPAVIPKRPVTPDVIPKRPVAPDVIPKRPVAPDVIPKRPVAPAVAKSPKASRPTVQDARDTQEFIRMCRKHLMVRELDSVQRAVWMRKGDCNVFLIGEHHAKHTKCHSIYDMFEALIAENRGLTPPVKFDLLLERYVGELGVNVRKYVPYQNHEIVQLTVVRDRFYECIEDKNCDVRVHWTDSTNFKERLPKWLYDLSKYKDMFDNEWEKADDIVTELQEKEHIAKLLTENTVVMKEIKKASLVDPAFTLEFALKMFERFTTRAIDQFETSRTWKQLVGYLIRNVIDLYAIARLVKSKMKHVIVYAGDLHVRNCIELLTALKFETHENLVGSCP
jgi:hypothetical protein